MAPQVDKLKNKERVGYRSSDQITRVYAHICLDENLRCVQIEFAKQEAESHGSLQVIRLADIEGVRAKDYPEDSHWSWVLDISQQNAPHIALQFKKREVRDLWDAGLKSLIPHCPVRSQALSQAEGQRQSPVQAIVLVEPRAGVVVSAKLELAEEREAFIEITEGQTSSQDCERIVRDFITDHNVLRSEATSLYRFLRCVVQRTQVEKEAATIVNEINALHFDRLMAEDDPKAIEDVSRLVEKAKERLTVLSGDLTKRLGQQGIGTAIVTQILRRNIEKMKLINNMTVKAYEAERVSPRA